MTVAERIAKLRALMAEKGIDAEILWVGDIFEKIRRG